MTTRRFVTLLVAVVALAAALRLAFPLADPPWGPTVGIVWHDEGAWVHNARNRALFGEWRLDDWNPMYIAPVFSGLEYLSFSLFGVGLAQARLVSMLAGITAVALLGLAVTRLAGRRAGLIAAALLATNHLAVMYSRAALMEATMVAWLVAAWYCAVRAERQPRWALGASLCALLAYFTKASAVFFGLGLGLLAVLALVERWWRDGRLVEWGRTDEGRVALWTLAGLAAGTVVVLLAFVVPNWSEYWFYNWQMSVTRKPSYTLKALADRVSWFPIVHDIFTRMWLVTTVGIVWAAGAAWLWRERTFGERVLLTWLALGTFELVARDTGNERYFVYLVPALVAAVAIALGRDGRLLPAAARDVPRSRALLALPVVLAVAYLITGSVVRLAFLYEVRPGVRWAAAVAVLLTVLVYARWRTVARWLSDDSVGPRAATLLVSLVLAGDLAQYGQWAGSRTYWNYGAMRLVGERLPPDTLVHGKLANGLALESRIRPIFVGQEFGNYDDRLDRDDIRYVLTYVRPRVGYEGRVITEILDAYPRHRVLWTVPVAESPGGRDLAALIEKTPADASGAGEANGPDRAHD